MKPTAELTLDVVEDGIDISIKTEMPGDSDISIKLRGNMARGFASFYRRVVGLN